MKPSTPAVLSSLILFSGVTFAQVSWDWRNPNGPQPGFDNPTYRGSSGAQYQYDLSKPRDQARYEIDPRAQLRDELSVDPRRDLDRDFGQRGAGILRDR